MKRTYLDAASAAPVAPSARKAFLRALASYGNPSAAHGEGREAKGVLEEARKMIAREAGMKATEVVFTASATEANNLAILGFAKTAPKGARFLYGAGAHASVVEPMRSLAAWGFEVHEIPLLNGRLDLEALRALAKGAAFVSLEAASSETGVRFDTRKARQILDEAREGKARALLHVDASQLPLVESFDRTRLGADLITLDAQKVGGVRGIGALLVSPLASLSPVIVGGGQEGGLRSGTPSPALAAAFAAAFAEAAKNREVFALRAGAQRELLKESLRSISGITVLEGKVQLPTILTLALVGRDTDYLVALLDEEGFAVSTRSACETDSEEGSRAALALTGNPEFAKSTLRVSWGPGTKDTDLKRFAKALSACVAFLDRR